MRSMILAAALASTGAAPAADWRPLDPENTLVVETSKGRIVVEMRPEFAPLAVARVKRLARERVYDGLLFHRVIDGFVDQTGNPDNKDGGTSAYPDLPAEFTFKLRAGGPQAVVADRGDGIEGFVGATPFAGVSAAEAARAPDGTGRAWGAYCAGVVAWDGRPIPAPPTAKFSSCGRRRGGSTTTTRSGAGWFRGWRWCARSRWVNPRPIPTG